MADEKKKIDVPFSDTWSHPLTTFDDFYRMVTGPSTPAPPTPSFRPPEQAGPAPPVSSPRAETADERRRAALAQNLKALGR
jgi:hypothetical protein